MESNNKKEENWSPHFQFKENLHQNGNNNNNTANQLNEDIAVVINENKNKIKKNQIEIVMTEELIIPSSFLLN